MTVRVCEPEAPPVTGLLLVGPWLAGVLLTACAAPEPNSPGLAREPSPPTTTETTFEQGVLFKPNPTMWESPAATLAPLLLWEVGQNTAVDCRGAPFGLVAPGAVEASHPAVYAAETQRTVHGRPHAQVLYLWAYPAERELEREPRFAGVRITLSSAGHPVLWETMSSKPEARQLFVSRSLEDSARSEFGTPLPERRYVIEGTDPAAAIVRILEDGPVPMGPIVYLEAASGRPSTVLCRCMPAQVREVIGTRNYDLLPIDNLLEHVSAEVVSRLTAPEPLLRWPQVF